MHVVDDALPGHRVFGRVQPGATGRDAAIGRRAGHLGDHHRRAAHRARAQVHQVIVTRHTVVAEYCAIGDTTTRFFSTAPRTLKGVSIGGMVRDSAGIARPACPRMLADPVLVAFEVRLVAQAQVLVR
jgi:hypothetical protein